MTDVTGWTSSTVLLDFNGGQGIQQEILMLEMRTRSLSVNNPRAFMFKWLLLCVIALSTVACGGSSEQVVETRGVVQSRPDLESGWWYIETATGEKYTPFPLPDEFKVPGLNVQVSMVLLKDTASVFPGIYVRVIGIEKLAVAAGG